jgi:hypothetical protein
MPDTWKLATQAVVERVDWDISLLLHVGCSSVAADRIRGCGRGSIVAVRVAAGTGRTTRFLGRHATFVRGASAKETRRIHRRDQYGGEAMLEARASPLEDPMNDMHLTLAKVEMTRRLADAASRRQRLSATTGRRPVRRFAREARSRLVSMP